MAKELNLTSEQQATVRAALQEKMDAMAAAQNAADTKIKAVLTADQAKKYDAMRMKHEKEMHEKMKK